MRPNFPGMEIGKAEYPYGPKNSYLYEQFTSNNTANFIGAKLEQRLNT